MMTIKGIVFDFDGLILDTETPEFNVWQEVFKEFGLTFPMEAYLQSIGKTYDDDMLLEFLKKGLGDSLDEEHIFGEIRQRKIALIEEEQLCDGVLDYLREAEQLGIRIGLASSSKRVWVQRYLEKFNIQHYFKTINTLDNVRKPKPDPELYVRAVAQLDLQPNEAIALEDSLNGVTSAKTAGLFTVAIPNPVTKVADFKQADLRLDKLTEIKLSCLINKAQAIGL